jgi:autotransporter-associated beta strand protein
MSNRSSRFSRIFSLHLAKQIIRAALLLSMSLLGLQVSKAGSATWQATPQDSIWNNPNNWAPQTVPDGVGDVATFPSSSISMISLGSSITLDSAVFLDGSGAFTVNVPPGLAITFDGTGVVNENTIQTSQSFILTGNDSDGPATVCFTESAIAGSFGFYQLQSALLAFSGNASADGATIDAQDTGTVTFAGNSTAGHAYLNIFPQSLPGAAAATAIFSESASAGQATVSALGANTAGFAPASIIFQDSASAATANVIAQGAYGRNRAGGQVSFLDTATADRAVIIGNIGQHGGLGGSIYFYDSSSGGTAYVYLGDNSALDISGHGLPGISLGALSGTGRVFLGANSLTIGNSGYSDTLTGQIRDGGVAGGMGGSLTKVGSGQLTLSGANTYTGGTIVASGILMVSNDAGSATGSGPVQVQRGSILDGTGIISGPVALSGTTHRPSIIEPGTTDSVAQLTTKSRLNLRHGSYYCTLDRDTATADVIVAKGITIEGGTFVPTPTGSLPLPLGAAFIVLNNTSITPINGTFDSLPEGSVIQLSNPPNNLAVSYAGGDGNDMTLTVVP